MNWRINLIISFFFLFQSVGISKTFLENQDFMSIEKAEKKYGSLPFNPDKFKTGPPELRAKMATSIIKTKYYVGKTIEKVKEDLGSSTGYFWNDFIPAYLIEDGKNKDQAPWQLVFLIDQKGRVGEVRIHKNGFSKK